MSTATCPIPLAGSELRFPPALDRRFEAIIFDWDGTAVPDRRADARELRAHVEELCERGLDLIVITGTHVENIDRQLLQCPRVERSVG